MPRVWELHPMLVHFPIALLLCAVAIMLLNVWKKDSSLNRIGFGMLVAGVLFGWLAAAAGVLAWYTVPAHTEAGHVLMYWHIGFALAMLITFSSSAIWRFRTRTGMPDNSQLALLALAALLLVVTGHLGASLVFRHGAGVDPAILSNEIREGHTHQTEHSQEIDGSGSKTTHEH